ncbi:MAG: hypothetical protein JWN39_2149, partial [Ilumatobacteraceae bacterium]|nr:hypothetical protein [Ilumatobacteraceae bacterium]
LCYWSEGRHAEAIELEEQVLANCERSLGYDHPNTLTARHNLAGSYYSAGRTSEAIKLEEQVVADSERILGFDHPHTGMSRTNLAGHHEAHSPSSNQ